MSVKSASRTAGFYEDAKNQTWEEEESDDWEQAVLYGTQDVVELPQVDDETNDDGAVSVMKKDAVDALHDLSSFVSQEGLHEALEFIRRETDSSPFGNEAELKNDSVKHSKHFEIIKSEIAKILDLVCICPRARLNRRLSCFYAFTNK